MLEVVDLLIVERSMVKCLENQGNVIYYPAFFMVAISPMEWIPGSCLFFAIISFTILKIGCHANKLYGCHGPDWLYLF